MLRTLGVTSWLVAVSSTVVEPLAPITLAAAFSSLHSIPATTVQFGQLSGFPVQDTNEACKLEACEDVIYQRPMKLAAALVLLTTAHYDCTGQSLKAKCGVWLVLESSKPWAVFRA